MAIRPGSERWAFRKDLNDGSSGIVNASIYEQAYLKEQNLKRRYKKEYRHLVAANIKERMKENR